MAVPIDGLRSANTISQRVEGSSLSALLEQFEVTFSNVESIHEAEVLFVGENHADKQGLVAIAQLAQALSEGRESHLTIFQEAFPSFHEVPSEVVQAGVALFASEFGLDHTMMRFRVFGWDKEISSQEGMREDHWEVCGPVLRERNKLFDMHQHLGKWVRMGQLNVRSASTVADLEEASGACTALLNEMDRIASQIEELTAQLQELNPPELAAAVSEEMPTRTASLVSTLQQLRERKAAGEFKELAVFQGGAAHFCTPPVKADDPNYALDSLFEELQHYRAMVLIPKSVIEFEGLYSN